MRYKDLFQAKTCFGLLDTLTRVNINSALTEECEGDMLRFLA